MGDTLKAAFDAPGTAFNLEADLQEYLHEKVLQRDLVHFREPVAGTVDPATHSLQVAMNKLLQRDLLSEGQDG